MVFFCLWSFAMVKANKMFALIFLGGRKLQNLEALEIVQYKKEMQGASVFHLDESLHRLKHVILMSVASVYGVFIFIKDAVLGKSVQGPPKHPRALMPEAGQWITSSTCLVSFPLAGSSSCTGAGAGLTACPGACQVQLEPMSLLPLPGALLFYEWQLLETSASISASQKQTLQYKWYKLYKGFASWWCPQLWWKYYEGKRILSAFWICFKYRAFYDFHMILGDFTIKRRRLS